MRAAVRLAGATFGSTVTLVPDGGQSAAVALDGRGGALVAWSRNGSLGLAERTAEAPVLTQVPAGAGEIADGSDVAFTGPGQAIVVWAGTDGAVHALSRRLGGATVSLPDLAPAPATGTRTWMRPAVHTVVPWSHVARTESRTTIHVRASALAAGGSFGPVEDLGTASSDRNMIPTHWSGSELTSQRVVASGSGAADVLFTELHFQGPPGEVALGGKAATRTMSGWAPTHASGVVDGPHLNSCMYVPDVAAGSAGDALYVEGFKPNPLPPMSFSARLRTAGAAGYGGASALYTGTRGEVRAAPLAVGHYLVLMRSGAGLRSRAGSQATGFGDHLMFSGTDVTRLLRLAGAPTGLAAAAWVTTGGQVHAAVYDASLGPGSLPPTAGSDDVAPMLSGLAVALRRFTTRRRARVRWRLGEPARVRPRVDRVRVGFRRGGHCVARRPQTGRVRRCARFQQMGMLTRVGQAGPTAVRFDRFGRRRAPAQRPLPRYGVAARCGRQPGPGTAGALHHPAPPVGAATLIAVRRPTQPHGGAGMTTASARRTSVPLRAVVALALIAATATATFVARDRGDQPPPPLCYPPAACVAALDGGQTLVSTSRSAPPDAWLEPAADGSVSLVGLDGRTRWRILTGSSTAPQLLAAGDVDTDGVTDYVLGLAHALAQAQSCGAATAAKTSLVVVDGRTGETEAPFGALPDVCWNRPTFNYPTQQWSAGTVYIGDFTTDRSGPEVVVLPYYAKRGRVWNIAETGRWELVRTETATSFAYPSTPAFDRAYTAANPTPCSALAPGGPCYTENSHVANAVFPAGAPGGLFVLTSSRAVVYRPDLTPTSDRVWWPGNVAGNGGRNYGLVDTYRSGGATYVDLVGGCSTLNRWRAIASGADPTGGDANCGMGRHFERFQLDGFRIAQHRSLYYGYVGTHGSLEGRVEFPARPRAALGGRGTSWTALNLLRSGAWSAQVFTGPMSTQPMELPGWYVWDTVEFADGAAGLLASPVAEGSLVPAWELDVLRWNGSSSFASVQHISGVLPVLLPHASTPTRHTSEAALYGAYVGADDERNLLVVDAAGKRSFVSLAEAG